MAKYTSRYGFSYFGGNTPGDISDDGGKFTLTDPQLVDRLLQAFEQHTHTGGARLIDPADAPVASLQEAQVGLPAGRTYYYVITLLDRYGLETAPSDEISVVTTQPVQPCDAPVLEAGVGTLVAQTTVTADNATLTVEQADFQPADVGKVVVLTPQVGASHTTTIATVVDTTTITVTQAAAFTGPAQIDVRYGELTNTYYQYALSVLVYEDLESGDTGVYSQETPLSTPAPITPPDYGIVRIGLPAMPTGGHAFRVWRKAINEPYWTKIGVVGPDSEYVDTGAVKASVCANLPENMPVTSTTPVANQHAIITLSEQDQLICDDEAMGVSGWRLYRSEVSGIYAATSLVAQTPREADGQLAYSVTDTGDPLLSGNPPMVSTTLTPTQPVPYPVGDLPELPTTLPDGTAWLTLDQKLYVLTTSNQQQSWTSVNAQVPQALLDRVSTLETAVPQLTTRVDTLEANGGGGFRGVYSPLATYSAGDMVTHNGVTYASGADVAPTSENFDSLPNGPFANHPFLLDEGHWVVDNGGVYVPAGATPDATNSYPLYFDVGDVELEAWYTFNWDNTHFTGTLNFVIGKTGGTYETSNCVIIQPYSSNTRVFTKIGAVTNDPVAYPVSYDLTAGEQTFTYSLKKNSYQGYTLTFTFNNAPETEVYLPADLELGTQAGVAVDSSNLDGFALRELRFAPHVLQDPWVPLITPPAITPTTPVPSGLLRYRGQYTPGVAYYPHDLVVNNNQLYLTEQGQIGERFDDFNRVDQPLTPHEFLNTRGGCWDIVDSKAGTAKYYFPALTVSFQCPNHAFSFRDVATNQSAQHYLLRVGADVNLNGGYVIKQSGTSRLLYYNNTLISSASTSQQPTHDYEVKVELTINADNSVLVTLLEDSVTVLSYTHTPTGSLGSLAAISINSASFTQEGEQHWIDDVRVIGPNTFDPAAWTPFPPT